MNYVILVFMYIVKLLCIICFLYVAVLLRLIAPEFSFNKHRNIELYQAKERKIYWLT